MLQAGVLSTIDIPGARRTIVTRITDSGDILGYYIAADGPPGHGFHLSKSGVLTLIDFPGAIGTRPRGLNARGDIVGWYTDPSGVVHGFNTSTH